MKYEQRKVPTLTEKQASLRPGYELVIPESVRALSGITMFWQPAMDPKYMDNDWRTGSKEKSEKDKAINDISVDIEYDADISTKDKIQKITIKKNDLGELTLLTTSNSEEEIKVFGEEDVVVSTTIKKWALMETTKSSHWKSNGKEIG